MRRAFGLSLCALSVLAMTASADSAKGKAPVCEGSVFQGMGESISKLHVYTKEAKNSHLRGNKAAIAKRRGMPVKR